MKKKYNSQSWTTVLIYVIVLVLFTLFFQDIKFAIYEKFNISDAWETRYSLTKLIFQHMTIAIFSSFIAIIVGGFFGFFCLSRQGKEFKILFDKISYVGQMIPAIALLNILAPVFGMGPKPAIVALVIFAIMPIYMGVITGVESVPEDLLEVAKGMGMSKKEEFLQVVFPIALPVIIAGLRTALIINVSAATLAAQIGGGGLGILLLNAMKTGKSMTIIEGTIPICLLAIITDKILKNIEDYFSIGKKEDQINEG